MVRVLPFGIVLAGHGSRDPDAVREFEALVELVRERAPRHRVQHGYLEFASPTIGEAVSASLASGARQVAVAPGVLLAARHAKNDMPAELLALARAHPGIDFHFGAPLNFSASEHQASHKVWATVLDKAGTFKVLDLTE